MLTNNPYKEGTMSHALQEAINKQAPIAPREKGVEKRITIKKVRATFEGTSKPQSASIRAAVLKFIQDAPEHTTTVEALEEHFKQPVRGFLQKLLEKDHIVVVAEE
jgi:hypothetical protein